ncbi:MAG: cysteine--tRNA ligase [Pseudomonadota bacterium]
MSANDRDLKLYDTLQARKRVFEPAQPERVTMYVCGPTVYDLAHIGNARPAVVFDVLFRVLQTRHDEVVYARNITDIDDKIIAACQQQGRSMTEFANEFTVKYREDMAGINVLPPSIEPQATHHIAEMIALTTTLIEKGHAYESSGHVLFDVQSMDDYGKLSHRQLEDMLAGARIEVADYKRYPGDFVLWKPSKDEEPGWESPWGRGRPGWHLECSAMTHAHLGETVDIHGGGRDLIFPHHENEIAQSECAHGAEYVRYWMHNAYLDIDGEKMSKSLGNFRTVRGLLDEYPGEVLRFALLSAHYRSPLNFSLELLEQARASLDGFYTALREVESVEVDAEVVLSEEAFYTALLDDLNTPQAISELHAITKALNKADAESEQAVLKSRLLAAGNLLGILEQQPADWFQSEGGDGMEAADIEAAIVRRQQAKDARDFALADQIRDELKRQNVLLEDSPEGTQWRRA